MLLYTIGASVIFTNLLLFFIYSGGCDGLLFTWIPLQTGIITITFLLNTEISVENLLNTLYFNFGSHIIPVIFLIVFVVGMRGYSPQKHPDWPFLWGIAISILCVALAGLYFFQNRTLLLICGVLGIFLNFINIQTVTFDDNDKIKVTWLYVGVCNVFTVVCVYGLDLLVLGGFERIAAVISSVPLVSVMVLAQSTYTTPGKEITQRHILMLAAQIWPSLTYVGISIICLELEWENSIIIPTVGSFVVVVIQYILFTRVKRMYTKTNMVNTVKYNLIRREKLQF
jgi:hypothetical protein